jgi:hypothetical protein
VSLNLFHLIALILAAGLGLDYALFFEHASADRAEQRRTLHAVLVCSLSTLMVFALLMISDVPVLRAIGVTVTLGVVFNFVLALLLTRPAASSEMRNVSISSLIPQQGRCACSSASSSGTSAASCWRPTHRSPSNPLRARTLRSFICANTAHKRWRFTARCARQRRQRTACCGDALSQFTRDWITIYRESASGSGVSAGDAASLQYSFRITHATSCWRKVGLR